MVTPVLLDSTRNWQCPACDRQHVSTDPRAITPLHACPKFSGLATPYVQVFAAELDRHKVRVVRVDREDYVGKEIVRTDGDGRPAMGVRTERADGSNDAHVFAPAAHVDVSNNPELAARLRLILKGAA